MMDATTPRNSAEDEVLTERLLDRWVDGELDEGAERGWLARLDGEPDGWRRLALAFVEGQRLRRLCGEVVARDDIRPPATPPQPMRPAVRQRSPRHGASIWLATACGVLVGVLWTLLVAAPQRGREERLRDPSAAELAALETRFAQLVAESYERLAEEEQQPASGGTGEPSGTTRPVLNVSLGIDDMGRPREWAFPIADDQNYPEQWYDEPMLTAADRERLALSGRTIQERTGILPVSLPDGRTAVVPVKSVQVRPASIGDFQ